MLSTLTLAVALSSAIGQSDQLTISNVRPTYGRFGPARPDNKVLPLDVYSVAFTVDGFKAADDGKITYSMAMQVMNDKGKVVYGLDPQDLETFNLLGGSSVPAHSYFNAATHPAGEYTLKVDVVDRASKARGTLTRKFEILPKEFGIVRLSPTYDPDNRLAAPASGVTGQSIWINFALVGFDRDSKKQPDVTVKMIIRDENNRPTVKEPLKGHVNAGVDQTFELLPMSFRLDLSRPGKFNVEIQATDKVSKKESKVSFPVTVTEPKGSEASDQK
jgi:hypothetical protein